MTKLQWIVVGTAVALAFVMYFGCDTTPKDIAAVEKTRALSAESTDIGSMLQSAKHELSALEASNVLALENELDNALADSAKIEPYKALSGQWYDLGNPGIAGYYAQQIAEIENTEQSWSIAGTTYTICIQRSEEEKIRDFCTGRAINAFENAISINPDDLAHQVNLALAYTYNPPQDNPMKGILILRELNQKAPDNVLVLNTLARLAIRTGQYDKAIERLERALKLEANNPATPCLLAQAYEASGNMVKAQAAAEKCRLLNQ